LDTSFQLRLKRLWELYQSAAYFIGCSNSHKSSITWPSKILFHQWGIYKAIGYFLASPVCLVLDFIGLLLRVYRMKTAFCVMVCYDNFFEESRWYTYGNKKILNFHLRTLFI
jgi:hypothetical protein